jgi:tRNA modification GTPase
MERNDTIAAISTPHGSGGVAIIRVSGPESSGIVSRLFKAAKACFPSPPKDLSFGRVHSPDGQFIDEAICLFFKGPGSYTGEDVVELQCHGGTSTAKAVLSAVIGSGARQARAGEFTRRAFLNGKVSLLKAESVLAMIKARTEKARQTASVMLSGKALKQAEEAKSMVSGLLARVEAVLDWPDEMSGENVETDAAEISRIEARIESMLDDASRGRLLIEGIKVAIIGRPNMGKSSLLNKLLGIDRAIVSDIPGTTRDTIEETANVEGIPIRFADTAGIGSSDDPILAAGLIRTKQAASSSSVIAYVASYPEGLTEYDYEQLVRLEGKAVIVVFNKADLAQEPELDATPPLPRSGFAAPGYRSVSVSAKTGYGMDSLRSAIATEAINITDFEGSEGPYARWISCLESCVERLSGARKAIDAGMPHEAVCLDLRDALYALGEFTGDTTADEIIDMVFDKFCIGK